MRNAVTMHLQLVITVDFTDGTLDSYMPASFTDDTLQRFLRRCPDLMYIYGFHPHEELLHRRHKRRANTLSVPGVVSALQQVQRLQGVETSNIFVLQAILSYLRNVQVLGKFKNRTGRFPPLQENRISLTPNPQVVHLSLVGVFLPSLPRLEVTKYLSLKWVRFTDPHPFRDFVGKNLRTFIMNNCSGPTNALKYVPLLTGLTAARSLFRLELVRVPFLGGLLQHIVEDSWRTMSFRSLQKILLGACKYVLEVDLGYLAITCCSRLEELIVQSSLTKDSLFSSLHLATVQFPNMEVLYLGYMDDFPPSGKWSAERLSDFGLAEVTECPSNITDLGVATAGRVFRGLRSLTIFNCPHLHLPTTWLIPGEASFSCLKELHLRRCHSIRLSDFNNMLQQLPSLETLHLEQMFREPPKGCSRVGLSAGTGLGVSSALVANTGIDPANLNPNNAQPAANLNAVNVDIPAAGGQIQPDVAEAAPNDHAGEVDVVEELPLPPEDVNMENNVDMQAQQDNESVEEDTKDIAQDGSSFCHGNKTELNKMEANSSQPQSNGEARIDFVQVDPLVPDVVCMDVDSEDNKYSSTSCCTMGINYKDAKQAIVSGESVSSQVAHSIFLTDESKSCGTTNEPLATSASVLDGCNTVDVDFKSSVKLGSDTRQSSGARPGTCDLVGKCSRSFSSEYVDCAGNLPCSSQQSDGEINRTKSVKFTSACDTKEKSAVNIHTLSDEDSCKKLIKLYIQQMMCKVTR